MCRQSGEMTAQADGKKGGVGSMENGFGGGGEWPVWRYQDGVEGRVCLTCVWADGAAAAGG